MKLAKQYTPNEFEPDIYAMWEASGKFEPTGKGEPFSETIMMNRLLVNLRLLQLQLEQVLISELLKLVI